MSYSHSQTRRPVLQELCLSQGTRAKGRWSQEPTSTPPFYSQHKGHSPQTVMPASQPSGRKRMSLPILSSSSTQPLVSTQPLWAMSTCIGILARSPAVQQARLESRGGSAYSWLSHGSYASSGKPADPGRWGKETGLCQGCPVQNP